MLIEEFKNLTTKRGLSLTKEQIEQLNIYSLFLTEYNEKVNLTAITKYEDILEKHFYDSLLPSFNKKLTGTLVDVGTGAGFPGVVLKICYPDLKVVLLEPINKRCVFLKELIEKLKLKNIEVITTRGEDYSINNREKYDYVTARAVTNLNNLIEVAGAMVKVGGYFIALRGASGIEEIEAADKAIKEMGFEIEETISESLPDGSIRIISYFRKIKASPKKYPRKYNIIKQRPLWVK